jgi:hypothetical protein
MQFKTIVLVMAFMAAGTTALADTSISSHYPPPYVPNYSIPAPAFFVSIGGGYANTNGFTRNLTNGQGFNSDDDYVTPYYSDSTNGPAGRAYLGYAFTPYFGTELGIAAFRKANWADSNGLTVTNQEYAADLLARLTMPLPMGFSLYGKLGYAHVWSEIGGSNAAAFLPAPIDNRDVAANEFTGGVGMTYTIYQQTNLEAYWQHYQGNQQVHNIDLGIIGISYYFA